MMWPLLLILIGGVVCVGTGAYLVRKDRKFKERAQVVEAEVIKQILNKEDRYQIQYRFSLDGHKVFGVLPDSTSKPLLRGGETIPLLVQEANFTEVKTLTSRRDLTVRLFLILIGSLMLMTAIPLLFFVA